MSLAPSLVIECFESGVELDELADSIVVRSRNAELMRALGRRCDQVVKKYKRSDLMGMGGLNLLNFYGDATSQLCKFLERQRFRIPTEFGNKRISGLPINATVLGGDGYNYSVQDFAPGINMQIRGDPLYAEICGVDVPTWEQMSESGLISFSSTLTRFGDELLSQLPTLPRTLSLSPSNVMLESASSDELVITDFADSVASLSFDLSWRNR